MSTPDLASVVGWIDARVRDARGRRVGRVCAVLADSDGTPWWLVVRRRGRRLLAPVAAVAGGGDHELLLSCTADRLVPTDGDLDSETHERLIGAFGLDRRGQPGARTRSACPPLRDRRRHAR